MSDAPALRAAPRQAFPPNWPARIGLVAPKIEVSKT